MTKYVAFNKCVNTVIKWKYLVIRYTTIQILYVYRYITIVINYCKNETPVKQVFSYCVMRLSNRIDICSDHLTVN